MREAIPQKIETSTTKLKEERWLREACEHNKNVIFFAK